MSTALRGIGPRLREVRRDNDLIQPVMAAAIDVSDRAYKYYEQERRELPAWAAVKLSERFKINLEWILTGRGKMYKNNDPEIAQTAALAVLSEHESNQVTLSVEKLSKIIGFVAEQASQTGDSPTNIATKYFETL